MKFMHKLEKQIRYTGLVYFVIFIVTAVVFLFFSNSLLGIFNQIAIEFNMAVTDSQGGKFWLVLATSMMTNISFLSWGLYRNPVKNSNYLLPLIISKLTSSILGLIIFVIGIAAPSLFSFDGVGSLAILIIFITDFPLGVWVIILHLKVKSEDKK